MQHRRIKVAEDAEFVFETVGEGLKITVENASGVKIVFHQTLEQANTLGDIFKIAASSLMRSINLGTEFALLTVASGYWSWEGLAMGTDRKPS